MDEFEHLRTRIKDESDRVLFDEATKCLAAGANRAAFIVAWLAAAEGLLNKLRRMANLDTDLLRFVGNFERSQAQGEAKDVTLVEKAAAVGFIDPTETKALSAVRDLRNQYGHPTETEPTALSARWAIEVAVDAVLSKDALLLRGAARALAKRLGTDPHYLQTDDAAITEWMTARAETIHPDARPAFIAALIEHHATSLEGVDERLATRCRYVAAACLAKWGEKLKGSRWDVEGVIANYPSSAADVLTTPDVWPLVPRDDQHRLLSHCIEATARSTPTLQVRLLQRAYALHEADLLTTKQEERLAEGTKELNGWTLLAAQVPTRHIIPTILDRLRAGPFDENKEGVQLLRAVGAPALAPLSPEQLDDIGYALARASCRNAWVAQNLLIELGGNPGEWPLRLRLTAAVTGLTEPYLLPHEKTARLAVGIALSDESCNIAEAITAALPDVLDEDERVSFSTPELLESLRELVEASSGPPAAELEALFTVAEAIHDRDYGGN